MRFSSVRNRLIKQRTFRQLLFGSVFFCIGIGVLIVPIEQGVQNTKIRTLSDGLWWSLQTLTTVGYGDVVPVSDVGRIIGVAMQVVGTVMFGALIALISSSMSRRQEEFYWERLFERMLQMQEKIDTLQKHIDFLIEDQSKKKHT